MSHKRCCYCRSLWIKRTSPLPTGPLQLAYAAPWVVALDDPELNDTCDKLSALIRVHDAATKLALFSLAAVCENNAGRQAAYVERVGCGALLSLDKAGSGSARAAIIALDSEAAFLLADAALARILTASRSPRSCGEGKVRGLVAKSPRSLSTSTGLAK